MTLSEPLLVHDFRGNITAIYWMAGSLMSRDGHPAFYSFKPHSGKVDELKYFQNGKLHRLDGAAEIRMNTHRPTYRFYINGKNLTGKIGEICKQFNINPAVMTEAEASMVMLNL